jgi:hypothetical protein
VLSIYRKGGLGEWASGNSSAGEGGFRRGRLNSRTRSDRVRRGNGKGIQATWQSDSEVVGYKGKKEPVGWWSILVGAERVGEREGKGSQATWRSVTWKNLGGLVEFS